jgi:hypothetical protein
MITKRPITWKAKILYRDSRKYKMVGYDEYIIEVMIIMAVIGGSEGRGRRGGLQGKVRFAAVVHPIFLIGQGRHSDDEARVHP